MTSLKDSHAWKALGRHFKKIAHIHMRDLFVKDKSRFEDFSLALDGLFLDYSKNRITKETISLLIKLARARNVEGWRDRMFAGEFINTTEERAALHVALRLPINEDNKIQASSIKDIVPEVLNMRDKMRSVSNSIRSGKWKGVTGKKIKTVVHIGTG